MGGATYDWYPYPHVSHHFQGAEEHLGDQQQWKPQQKPSAVGPSGEFTLTTRMLEAKNDLPNSK